MTPTVYWLWAFWVWFKADSIQIRFQWNSIIYYHIYEQRKYWRLNMKTKFFYCFYDYLLFKIILNANYWEFKSIFFIVMLLIQFFLRFQLMQEELLGRRTYFPGFFFAFKPGIIDAQKNSKDANRDFILWPKKWSRIVIMFNPQSGLVLYCWQIKIHSSHPTTLTTKWTRKNVNKLFFKVRKHIKMYSIV